MTLTTTPDAEPAGPEGETEPHDRSGDGARPGWLHPDVYPFPLKTVAIDDETMTYVDEGAGPTLLFVHTGMWSFIFRDVIQLLRTDFRCITVDFPGYGLSVESPTRELGLADQAALLGGFVQALDLDDLTLVLHDLGGLVGTGFAAQHPDRVRGFVMANTFVWQPDTDALVRMLRVMSSRPMIVFDRLTRLVPRLTSTRAGVGRHLDSRARRVFRRPFRDPARLRRFHTLMGDALEADDLYQRIAAASGELARRPVLTIFGEKNDPFGFQDRHHATFLDHEGVVVAGGNHFPMMDDPELFVASVRSWWARHWSDAQS